MSIAAMDKASGNMAGVVAAALLFAALAILLDGPLWLVQLVPTQDGPVHLAQADLIARFGWGGALQEPAASFYQWNPRIEPNSAIYLVLAGLIRLTGDALVANTLFLSLYGLVWIAAAFAVCRAETERPMLPILLLLPLAFGVFIHWGFYNSALGVPLFLLFASYWRKARERRNAATFLFTALFLAGLYLTHITAVVAACLLLAADGMARAIRTLERSGPRVAARQLLIDGASAAAAALPVLLLIASFLIAYRNIPGETPGAEGGVAQILRRIFAATHLFSFTWWEVVALAPLLGALGIAGVAALRRIKSGDLMWPVFFGLVVLLSLLNLKTGSALLSERLAPLQLDRRRNGDCQPSAGSGAGPHALPRRPRRPDRPDRDPRRRLQELVPDPGKRTCRRPRQPRRNLCQYRPDRFTKQRIVRLARSPDVACGPDRGSGRARRRPVVAAAVDPVFRLFPAAICRSPGFHARDAGLGLRTGRSFSDKIPQCQSGRTARADRVILRCGRIGAGAQAWIWRLQDQSGRRAGAGRLQGRNARECRA